jgi:hypothetical protein
LSVAERACATVGDGKKKQQNAPNFFSLVPFFLIRSFPVHQIIFYVTSHESSMLDEHDAYFCELRVAEAETRENEAGLWSASEHQAAFDYAMKEHKLYFSLLSNGTVHDVLAHRDESKMMLNIKRSMLTALQTQLLPQHEFERRFAKRSDGTTSQEPITFSVNERDIVGDCESELALRFENEPNEVHITRQKDVNKCTRRPMLVSFVTEEGDTGFFFRFLNSLFFLSFFSLSFTLENNCQSSSPTCTGPHQRLYELSSCVARSTGCQAWQLLRDTRSRGRTSQPETQVEHHRHRGVPR